MGWFVTLKKGQKYGFQNRGAKKQGHFFQKEKRQPGLFSFGITMTTLVFFNPYFGPFFKVPDPENYQADLIN